MGFLDLFGPPQESRRSKDSLPSVASTRPDKHRGADTFQEPVDLNTAWRYFRHDLTSHHDAGPYSLPSSRRRRCLSYCHVTLSSPCFGLCTWIKGRSWCRMSSPAEPPPSPGFGLAFVSCIPRFRLPLTLDLLDTTHEVYMALVDMERRLSTASLRLFHMDKATEQLRMLFVTVHSAVLVPLGLADVHDTCGLAALGLATRRALLPFLLATSRRPQAPDFVRLVKTLQSQFRRASALGPVAAQFVSIVLYTCCCADDGVVSRE
ncbi:hypothetical protein DYB28_009214, partial [Aphanomyces astaci]